MVGKEFRRVVASGAWGWELTGEGHEGTFWGDGNVLYLDRNSGYIGVHDRQNSMNTPFVVW